MTITCDCGFEARAGDEAGLVAEVKRHASKAHGMRLSDDEARALVVRAECDLSATADGASKKEEVMKKLTIVAALVTALAAFVAVTKASPPSGVTATVLARGTFPSFNVRSDPHGPIADFRAHSTEPIDIVVRRHDYAAGASTGWHQHPGPIFITVTQGQLTYYEYDDPTCTPHVITAGHGFVDTGDGHIVRNETDQPAEDISVITAPVGAAFRTELPAPNPNCGF